MLLVLSFVCTGIAPEPSLAASSQDVERDRGTAAAVPMQSTSHAGAADRSKTTAVDAYLKHAYTVYFGLRACSELSAELHDGSFLPSVPLEESRRTLKSIDAAAAEVSIDANAVWLAAAPGASVTAEALKADPGAHVEHCRKMGSLFRVNVGNLQPLLQSLGAKTVIMTKDY